MFTGEHTRQAAQPFVKENDYQTEKGRINSDLREQRKKGGESEILLSIPNALGAPGQEDETP